MKVKKKYLVEKIDASGTYSPSIVNDIKIITQMLKMLEAGVKIKITLQKGE